MPAQTLITTDVLITALVAFPALAALLLVCYPLVMRGLQRLPEEEVLQAGRAPAWLAVVVGAGMAGGGVFGLMTLRAPAMLGWPGQPSVFLADSYTLWCAVLLGIALLAGAWAPAARRSLAPHAAMPFAAVIALAGVALVMLAAVRLDIALIGWVVLLLGSFILWWRLLRPARTWRDLEPGVVLLLCGVLAAAGLLWLHLLAHGNALTENGALLAASPRVSSGAALLVVLGWLGLAAYLPWWLGGRRDEPALVWQPAGLVLATTGVVGTVRLLALAFPVRQFAAWPGMGDHMIFLQGILVWLLGWGMFALLAGTAWAIYLAIVHRRGAAGLVALRPLPWIALGALLLGTFGGLRALASPVDAESLRGAVGLLWAQFAWLGVVGVWLTAGSTLSALTTRERGERGLVVAALALALVALAGAPPMPAFHAWGNLWGSLTRAGLSPLVPLVGLVAAAGSLGWLLPRWAAGQSAPQPRPGAAWGLLAPFLLAGALLAGGLLATPLRPAFTAVWRALVGG